MANAAAVYDNLADDATISASTQVLLTPVANLQNPHIARKWRSTSTADYFVADLLALTSIDTVSVIGLTATTIRIRISSVDSSGSAGDLYDSGVVAIDQDYLQYIAVLGAPVSGRYVRVDLANSVEAYVEAGRAVIGLRTAYTYNFGFNWQRAYVDPSIRTKTRGGQTQVSNENTYRTLDVTFEWVTVEQRNGFVETIDRVNGLKTDILFMTDTASTNMARDSVWGLITDLTPVTQPFFDIYSKQYKIEERR